MFSDRTMKKEDWKKLRYFHPLEFDFPDRMGYQFMLWLDEVRDLAGVPFIISSDGRTKAHNKSVGGAKDSAHTDTIVEAVDIAPNPTPDDPNWNHARYLIVKAAMEKDCTRLGVYAGGSIHLDRTEGKRPGERIWIQVDNPT